MEELKESFLELLERDKEFRYAVAGYLGLSEVLKRLDVLAEEQVRLRKEQVRFREEQAKIWKEIAGLREEQAGLRKEQISLREEQTKIWKEIAGFREEQVRFREEQAKIWREIAGLREDFNKMFRAFDLRLSRVERTLEKLTVDVEDEARSFVGHRLREMGVGLELTSLILPDLEVNLYGVSDDVCVVGEASVRAGAGLVDELSEKLEKLRRDYPDRLRKRVVLVLYVSLPMVELVERVKRENLWLLKATEEFYRPEKLFLEL
jgi:hypothetical protein